MGVDFEDYFPDGSYYSQYYMASQTEYRVLDADALLIFRGVDFSDAAQQSAVLALVAAVEAEEHTLVHYASFLRDYRVYAAQHGFAASGPSFYDGLQTFLSVTQPLCIAVGEKGDVPCASTPGEAQRLVIPATYSADLAWRGGVIDAARLQCKLAAPESIWVVTLTLARTRTRTQTRTRQDRRPRVGPRPHRCDARAPGSGPAISGRSRRSGVVLLLPPR